MQQDDAFSKDFDAKLARRVLRYLKPYQAITVLVLVAALLLAVLQPLFGLLQRHAIDCYLVQTPGVRCEALNNTPEALFNALLLLAAAYLGLKLFEFGLRYGFTYALSWIGQHVLYDIRSDLFSKLQRLHLGYYDKNPVGRLITRVTSDVDAINMFITNGLAALVTSTFLILAYMIIMISLDWRLALISFTVLPVLFWVTAFFRRHLRDAYRNTRIRQAIVNTQLNENITGMLTVQLFNREGRNQVKFDLANRAFLRSLIDSVKWFSLFMPTVQLLAQVAVGAVLYYAGNQILVGAGVTLGTLVAFIGWVTQLFQPIQDLADVLNNLQAAMASSERIFGVLDTEEEIKDPERPHKLEGFRGQVDLEGVWFAYDTSVTATTPDSDERWTLRGIDLHIRPGESVALVGATGAGKTSIISLVSRFYDVQRGAVKVDGHDVRAYAQHDLRKHIGVVLQDVFLFAGTIESNLRLGDESIPLERIVQACKYVGVHDFIMSLPDGYKSEVRERGATLSTGQKQLLAFARALIQNPDILLVLDEATASVDTETELQIQEALTKVMAGRTSIIIAHRLSTIEHCDRIVVMRKGRVVEQGSHLELLARGGYYSKLYQLQYAGQGASLASD
ncbi:ATP-binding cassette subfamily B protein [Deinobacterium chartae]|uniref:ATP-binding cassette subfamily B protein n=1 Tax=Deinobacterium chartae TaxID=521158 RepID=A0A841I4K3_9DEIO|nr:ABC transporter ATP-binding protein [Deinobacterium chartae]MBB6099328.1 ATP-binding cassette subfamily B protein [Deinobacterium chartae]